MLYQASSTSTTADKGRSHPCCSHALKGLLTLSQSSRNCFIVLHRLGVGSPLLSAAANSSALTSPMPALLRAIHGER